jgi:RimJ/RimL family protein N-acetyltransferase
LAPGRGLRPHCAVPRTLADRLRAPAGIELRRWRTEDLDRLLAAIEVSFAELHAWMPWAEQMPTPDEELDVLRRGQASFDAGAEWAYFLYEADTGELVGGIGLHPRLGPGALEIGYWVRSDRTGRGYATAAVRALTNAAFVEVPELERIEIHTDQANRASAAVPPKLGYRLARRGKSRVQAPGHSGRTYVWELERSAWEVGE